jgi:hypothetical protein
MQLPKISIVDVTYLLTVQPTCLCLNQIVLFQLRYINWQHRAVIRHILTYMTTLNAYRPVVGLYIVDTCTDMLRKSSV